MGMREEAVGGRMTTEVFSGRPWTISSTRADLDCSMCMMIPSGKAEEWGRTKDRALLERVHPQHAMIVLCIKCGCYQDAETLNPESPMECQGCFYDGGGWHGDA